MKHDFDKHPNSIDVLNICTSVLTLVVAIVTLILVF